MQHTTPRHHLAEVRVHGRAHQNYKPQALPLPPRAPPSPPPPPLTWLDAWLPELPILGLELEDQGAARQLVLQARRVAEASSVDQVPEGGGGGDTHAE